MEDREEWDGDDVRGSKRNINQQIEREIKLLANDLGHWQELEGKQVFMKMHDTVICLKELLGHYFRDVKEGAVTVKELLGRWNTVNDKIIPLFVAYREDHMIQFAALKLLVYLTEPLQREDKAKGLKGVSDEDFSIQLGYLQSYKEKFCRGDAVRVMMQMLVDTAERLERSEEDVVTNEAPAERWLEYGLHFLKNLLAIPDPEPNTDVAVNITNLTHVLVKNLLEEGVLSFFGYVCEQHGEPSYKHFFESEKVWDLVDIFYYIVARFDPAVIVAAANSSAEKSGKTALQDLFKRKPSTVGGPPLPRNSRMLANTLKAQRDESGKIHLYGTEVQTSQRAKNFREKSRRENYKHIQLDNYFTDLQFINTDSHMLAHSASDMTRGLLAPTIIQLLKRFIEDFVMISFTPLMHICNDALNSGEQLGQNKEESHRIILNLMAWVLEFHILNHRSKCEALRKEGKDDETVDCASVQFCINLEALNLVRSFLVEHGEKREKTAKVGENARKHYVNQIIGFRALCQQIKMAQLILESKHEETFKAGVAIAKNITHSMEGLKELLYALKTFSVGNHDHSLLSYTVEGLHRMNRIAHELKEAKEEIVVAQAHRNKIDQTTGKALTSNIVVSQEFIVEALTAPDTMPCHIPNLMYQFAKFATNGPQLNYMLGSLLYLIVKKEKWCVAMFFQLPYLYTMLKVLEAAKTRIDAEDFRDLTTFARYVVARFFSVVKKNPFAFAEVFIPMRKTQRTGLDQLLTAILQNYDDDESAHLFEDMSEGDGQSYYDLIKPKTAQAKAKAGGGEEAPWSTEEDELLRENFELYADSPDRIKFLRELLPKPPPPQKERSARSVVVRLKALGLIGGVPEPEASDVAELTEASWGYRVPENARERAVLEFLSAAYMATRGGEWEIACPSDVEPEDEDDGDVDPLPAPKRRRVGAAEGEEGWGFEGLRAGRLEEDDGQGLLDELLAECAGATEGFLDVLLAEEGELPGEGLLDELLREEADEGGGLLDDLLREHGGEDAGVLDSLLREEAQNPPGTGLLDDLLAEQGDLLDEGPGVLTQLLDEHARGEGAGQASQPSFDLEDLME